MRGPPKTSFAQLKPGCRPNFLHQFWKNKQFTGTRTRLSPGLDAMKIDFQAFAG